MKEYEIDGSRFSTLDEFFDEIDRVLQPGQWGRNLNAFNDSLRGGFGTPDEGFTLRWKNHQVSRERLGHGETVRRLEKALTTVHPSHIPDLTKQLQAARAGNGPTAFDWLIEIIRLHGAGGREADDNVRLVLD